MQSKLEFLFSLFHTHVNDDLIDEGSAYNRGIWYEYGDEMVENALKVALRQDKGTYLTSDFVVKYVTDMKSAEPITGAVVGDDVDVHSVHCTDVWTYTRGESAHQRYLECSEEGVGPACCDGQKGAKFLSQDSVSDLSLSTMGKGYYPSMRMQNFLGHSKEEVIWN